MPPSVDVTAPSVGVDGLGSPPGWMGSPDGRNRASDGHWDGLATLLDGVFRFLAGISQSFCCVQDGNHRRRDQARLICYLDGLDDSIVRRQLEFRKMRRTERDASYSSLASLAVVSEEDELYTSLPTGINLHKVMSTPVLSDLMQDNTWLRTSGSEERLRKSGSEERLTSFPHGRSFPRR